MIFLLLTSVLVSAGDLPYKDEDFGCFAAAEGQRYAREFSVDVESFGGMELCDGRKDTKKLFNDFRLIEQSRFSAGTNHPFIRGFVNKDQYYSWMKQQTRGVRRGHDVPWATAYNSWGYFTMQDGWAVLSTLGRVGTIIHEARHTEGYPHYRCSTGPYADSSLSGCDTSFSQGGSHGVEMEYYARVVLESTNLHPVYKSMARLMAMGRSNFVFNQMPMQKREALLARSEKDLTLWDGKVVATREIPPGSSGELKRTSFGAALFTEGRPTIALDLYEDSALGVALNDDYSYFKLFQVPRDGAPAGVKALEEVDQGNLRFFVVLGRDQKLHSYNFPEGKWFSGIVAPVAPSTLVTLAPNGQSGLFAVGAQGEVMPVDLRTRRVQAVLPDRWPANVSRFVKAPDGRLLSLMSNGRFVDSKNGQSIVELPASYTETVNVPLYDAFTVAP
jgi:hypothetical protein